MNIAIICQCDRTGEWLKSCVMLSGEVTAVRYMSLSKKLVEEIQEANLLVVTKESLPGLLKRLKQSVPLSELAFPLLVLSDHTHVNYNSVLSDIVFSEFPLQSITPTIIEHLVSSVVKDFEQKKQLRKLAHYDELTGATNRHLFGDRLKQAIQRAKRAKEPIALIAFDLDKFKAVNDTYGHEMGDELLKCFVDETKACLRGTDTIARLGGDEFAALLPKTGVDDAIEVVERIKDRFNVPFRLINQDLQIYTSIGVASYRGDEDKSIFTVSEIKRRADIAVYEAKREGLSSYKVYKDVIE